MGYKIFDLKTKSFLDDEEQEKRIKKLGWDSQKLQDQVDISREKSLASTFKQQAKPVQTAPNKPAQSWKLNSNGVKNTVTASKIPSFPKDSLQDKPKKAAIKSSPIKNDSDVLNLVQSTRKNLVQQKQQKATVPAVRKASVANDSDILNLVQSTRKNLIQQRQQKAAVPAVRKAPVANDSDILNLVQNTRENLVRQKQTQTAAAQSLSFDDLLAKETLNPAEVTAAKKLIKERKAEYQKRLSGHLKNFESISPEDQAYSMLTSQLQNKVSDSAAFSMGLMNGASFGLLNQAAKKQDAAAEALAPALQPALTEAVKKGIDSRQGKSVVEAAAAQNPAAYGAGNFAGEAAKYSAFAPMIEELPVVGKAAQKAGQGISKLTGGKVSADLAGRLVSGRMVDLPFDVINAAVDTSNMENAGERLKTIGSNVAKDQLSGLAMDAGMEVLGAGYRAIKNTIREKPFRAFLDPQNISDTDIDGYLNQIHAQDGPKREKLKDLPQKRAIPILSMEKVPETKINPGARKSIRELAGNIPQEGYEIPKFNSQSKLFTDAQGDPLPVSKYPAAIQKYMVEHFKGKVLDIGPDRVFINKAGIKEFSFPVRRMQEAERLAKFSAGEHLDETLKPARFLLNVADADARHPDVTGGWDNYYVMFQVDDDIYSGIVKTKNTAKGRQFYDISEIKKEDVPPATYGVNGKNPPPAMPGTSSSPNITQRFQEINGKNRNGGVDITAGGLLPDVSASKTGDAARTAAADVRHLSPIDRMKNGINGMNAWQREAFRQEKLAKLKNIEDTYKAAVDQYVKYLSDHELNVSRYETEAYQRGLKYADLMEARGQSTEKYLQDLEKKHYKVRKWNAERTRESAEDMLEAVLRGESGTNAPQIIDENTIRFLQENQSSQSSLYLMKQNFFDRPDYLTADFSVKPKPEAKPDITAGGLLPDVNAAKTNIPPETAVMPEPSIPEEARPLKKGRYYAEKADLKSAEAREALAGIGEKGVSNGKDPSRNFDAMAGKNKDSRKWLKENVEQPWLNAKNQYRKDVLNDREKLREITEGLGIKKGSKESAAVQWYGEGKKPDEFGKLHQYTLQNLKEEFPERWQDIVKADHLVREIYDDLFERTDTVLRKIYPYAEKNVLAEIDDLYDKVSGATRRALGYKKALEKRDLSDEVKSQLNEKLNEALKRIEENKAKAFDLEKALKNGNALRDKRIPYRQNYYYHYQEPDNGPFGIYKVLKQRAAINPKLVGVSDTTRPKAKWAGFLQPRGKAPYHADAVGGLLEYIPQAEYKINMDPVTARNREIVDTLREITRGEANKAIEWMDDWTNDLAGKTNPFDRGIQKETGRRIMKGVEWLNGRVKSNAVLGNFASAAAQFFNAPNGVGYIKNPVDMAAGAKDWVKSVMPVHTDIDDLLEQSGFLGERYLDKGLSRLEKSDQLLKNILHSPQQFAEWMLNVGDEQTTKWIWLSAYNQAERKGIADAVAYADDIARRSVGGRGIGEIPLMQKSRIVQLLAPFQLEVNNAYQSVKEHLTAGDYLAVLEIAASGFLMNEVSEKLLGRRIAWDPIGAFWDAEESIPEEAKENIHPLDRIAFHGLRQFGEAVSNMPFGNYISAFLIPDQYRQTLLGDTDPTRYGTGGDLGISTLVKPFAAAAANSVDRVMGVADEEKMNIRNPDWQNAALQFLMPFGGKQLDRTLKAAQDMSFIPRMPWDKAGEFAPDMPAAYNNTGRFKFSIDTQDKANVTKGLLFGTNAIKEGIQYAKSGSYPLNGNASWAIQKAYTHGVMPDRFLELSGIIENMKPDRDGDRVIMTKKAKQEQFIMDSPDLDAGQKRWLMGYFLPEDTVHRDYSSPHAFIISGLQDSKQELWQYDSVKKAVGNNAVSYKAVLDTVSNLNYYAGQQGDSPSRQEKIQAIASVLNLPLYQSENIYAEIYEYKHALEDFSEEQQAKIANGPAASGFSDQDIIDMMNTLNHVKANQRVEALTNAGYSQEDASRFVDTMFYCKYTRDDLSEKENEILDSLKTKYNMSEDAFFTAYNLVNGIPGVKNANGKTISGSQKKARFKALASAPGWNQEGARNFLMELYGYTDKSWF